MGLRTLELKEVSASTFNTGGYQQHPEGNHICGCRLTVRQDTKTCEYQLGYKMTHSGKELKTGICPKS